MKDIIQELTNIETKYQIIMEKIKEDKKKLPRLIEEKIAQGARMVNTREREKIIHINKEIELDTQLKLKKIHNEFQEKKVSFELEYEKNKELWEKEIINKIISFGGDV